MRASLRFRLALLCASMTSIVLIGLMAVICFLTEQEQERWNQSLFQTRIDQITDQLLTGNIVQHDWLQQVERGGKVILSITDGENPLLYKGSWTPRTDRDVLIQKARETALKMGYRWTDFYLAGSISDQILFPLEGEAGDSYRAGVARIAAASGDYSITILADQQDEFTHLRHQRVFYLSITVIGILLFSLLSWILAGIAARPTEQSMEQQNAFVAAASHELRSPLAALSACASAILVEPEKTACYVESITKECGRLGRLVDDLLILAHSGIKSWGLKKEPIDLDTLLIEATEQLYPIAKQEGHSLTLELPEDESLPTIYGNGERLGQAVRNLIANAVSYSGGECSIEVKGTCSGERIVIEVVDHGIGIPERSRNKIFQRFYRIDETRTDKSHFGLGLSICQELVQLHGGELRLKETPGGGCTFQIILKQPSFSRAPRP